MGAIRSDADPAHNLLDYVLSLLPEASQGIPRRLRRMSSDQHLELRPQMIEVNSLVEQLRSEAKQDFDQSKSALDRLEVSLRDKVGVDIKLAPKITSPA